MEFTYSHEYIGPTCDPDCTLEPEAHGPCDKCGEIPADAVHHGGTAVVTRRLDFSDASSFVQHNEIDD